MPQSLFTSQTPATVNADNANPLHVGTYLTFSEDGEVSAARWYPPTTAQSGVKAAFYRTIDSVKLSVTDVTFSGSIAGPGWVEVDFDSPIPVTTGVQYAIVIRTPRYYSATTGGSSPWPLTNDKISSPATAGRFNDDDNADVQMVATTFNNGCYFADVVYTPDSEVVNPSVTPSGIAVPIALGEPTTRMVITPDGIAVPVTAGEITVSSEVPFSAETSGGGWRTLVSISQEQHENMRQETARPVACPYDGEPLRLGRGYAHCRFCGYTTR
jgi:hypothetical protein